MEHIMTEALGDVSGTKNLHAVMSLTSPLAPERQEWILVFHAI